jgi:serine/threonine-protein phosphatase 2A regulatory subunit B'
VNPQLFDDCTHEYGAQQNAQVQKKSDRKARWDRVEQLALARKGQTTDGASNSTPLPRVEEGDPLENQRRMEALRLQDDSHRSSSSVSQ